MEIFGLMSLGLFLGMTHAMDADHIAAVSAMWNRQGGKYGLMRRGLYWGAGHGIALLALCALLLSTGRALSVQNQALLEFGASLLILYLGMQLIWRMYRRRVHIHIHEHDGKRHLHMHSHINDHAKSGTAIRMMSRRMITIMPTKARFWHLRSVLHMGQPGRAA